MNIETWIHNEVMDGLSRLLCLGLERTPAADMIEGTAAMWGQALTDGRQWDRDLDSPRFRKAFVLLARTRIAWPAPLHFLETVGGIPREQLALTKQHIPANPERAAAAIASITRTLSGKDAAAEQGAA